MKLKSLNFLRKLKVISSLAFNILQFFAAIVAIITTTGGAAFVGWLLHAPAWFYLLIGGYIFGVFTTFIFVLVFILKSSPPRWVLGGYKCVKTESLYIIHEDEPNHQHHTLINEVEIEAVKAGVKIYESTYLWSGHGKENEPKILSPGHTFLGKIVKQNGWKFFYIHLGQELKIGTRTTVKTRQEFYDTNGEFEPFLSKVVSVPMDLIVLHVVLPQSLSPSKIYFKEWDAAGPAGRVIRELPGKIHAHSGEIRWEIPSPVFRHRYSINWTY